MDLPPLAVKYKASSLIGGIPDRQGTMIFGKGYLKDSCFDFRRVPLLFAER
jgi:hypothetical protein